MDFVNCRDLFFVGVEFEITLLPLVSLSYQPTLDTNSRSHIVYGFTIRKTYHYPGYNSSYLTLNRLDRIIPTKKKSDLDLHQAPIVPEFLVS